MQNQIEHTSVEQSLSFRASQAHCSIALPYVDPLSSFLVGQPILLKGKAKKLLEVPLPKINSVELNYKSISETLIAGIESGALSFKEVQSIIEAFNDKTSARKVIHTVNVKMRNHEIADELNAIKANAVDIYKEVHSLGYETDELDVAEICYEDDVLMLEFGEPLSICVYDDSELPKDIQFCLAAVARYFGILCSTSPTDHFLSYSDDFETINQVDKSHQKRLLALDTSLENNDYINAFRQAMPTEQLDEYVETLESYYAYCFEEEEHHEDIVHMIKSAVNRLSLINKEHFSANNHYQIKDSKKLSKRVNRLVRRYENTSFTTLLVELKKLVDIAHKFKNLSTYDLEFEGEVFDLSYHQAITFKSVESDLMWNDLKEAEKHIMETGDYAKLIMDIESDDFMEVLRNHQLGWLLGHCLEQLLKEKYNV